MPLHRLLTTMYKSLPHKGPSTETKLLAHHQFDKRPLQGDRLQPTRAQPRTAFRIAEVTMRRNTNFTARIVVEGIERQTRDVHCKATNSTVIIAPIFRLAKVRNFAQWKTPCASTHQHVHQFCWRHSQCSSRAPRNSKVVVLYIRKLIWKVSVTLRGVNWRAQKGACSREGNEAPHLLYRKW